MALPIDASDDKHQDGSVTAAPQRAEWKPGATASEGGVKSII